VTEKRFSTLESPFTNHTHMLKKCFVGDMCTPYRKKITSNQDRVGCVHERFSYGAGWRELRVSMEFETVAMATPCFLAKGCSWGSLPFLFYPSSNANRKSMCVLARIFSWPWFTDEKAIGNYSCNPCTIIEGTYKFYIKKKDYLPEGNLSDRKKVWCYIYYIIKYITFSFSQLCGLF